MVEEPQDTIVVTRSVIWLEDGNIVLEAENTLFKSVAGFWRGVFSIFTNVFSVPQLSEGEPTVEGCPLLRLQDSAQDIIHLLSALYDQ